MSESKKNDYGKNSEGLYGCFNFYPAWIQGMNRIGCLTFFMSLFCFIYGFATNGVLIAAISTLEKRFELSSSISGIILSAYDIGFLIFTIPLETLTRNMNRGRVLGWSCVLVAFTSLFYSIPHFATEDIIPISSNSTQDILCHTTRDRQIRTENNLNLWSILFICGGILMGIAMIVPWTNGYATVEDQTTVENGAFNMALMNLGAVFGPLFGIFAGGICIGMLWSDILNQDNIEIDSNDENWIGAWWLSFFVNGIFGLLLAVPVFCFPNQFPGASTIKEARAQKQTVYKTKHDPDDHSTLNDFKLILSNPIWILTTIGTTCDFFLATALIAFGIKFLQEQFYISAAYASIVGGICSAGCFVGIIVSLAGMKFLKPSSSQCLFASGASGIMLFIIFIPSMILLTCGNQPINGVFDQSGRKIEPPVFENACNEACSCSRDIFFPICDTTTNMTYLTPCNAGCTETTDDIFQNCLCSDGKQLTNERCPYECNTMWPFAISFCFVFGLLYAPVPLTPSAVMRSVEPRLKSFQVSLLNLFIRIFGSIPGPIIIGILIDGSCAVWQYSEDGERGSCFIYDNVKMLEAFMYFPLSMKFIAMICYFVAGEMLRKNENKTINEEGIPNELPQKTDSKKIESACL